MYCIKVLRAARETLDEALPRQEVLTDYSALEYRVDNDVQGNNDAHMSCKIKCQISWSGGGGLSFFCIFLVPPTTDMRHTRHAVLLLEMKGR